LAPTLLYALSLHDALPIFGLAGHLSAHARGALELVDAGLGPLQAHVHQQLVARLHDALEARTVDAGEVIDGLVVGRHTQGVEGQDRKSTRLNSSHVKISYA